MKRIAATIFVLGLGMAVQATAQTASCPAGTSPVSNVQQLVSGNTMCATRGSDSWQEYHEGVQGGTLSDFKRGANDPVDPSKVVGTWSAQNGTNSSLTHSYTGGQSYTWLVCQEGVSNSYTLVSTGNSGTITGVTLRGGNAGCSVAPAAARRRP